MATTMTSSRRGDRRGDTSRTTSRSLGGATLERNKTLAIAGVLVLLGYLYLRSRSNASGIAVSTDPTAAAGGGGSGIGYDPEATASAIQDAQGGVDELAGQVADLGSALNDLSVQQAQDAADAQSSIEAAAISAQVYNDNTSLAVAGPTIPSVSYSAPANINPAGEGTAYATAPTLLDARQAAALGDYLVPGLTAPPRSTLSLYGTPDASPTPAATSPEIGATTITNAPVASPNAIAAEPRIITSGSKPVMA